MQKARWIDVKRIKLSALVTDEVINIQIDKDTAHKLALYLSVLECAHTECECPISAVSELRVRLDAEIIGSPGARRSIHEPRTVAEQRAIRRLQYVQAMLEEQL